MDEIDRRIINSLQQDFPVCSQPYLRAAENLGITEQDLIARLQRLLTDGVLTRFGPLYNAQQMGGALTLAAMKVPEERFDEVTNIVNAFPEVAHNYARQHELNMWFVLATERPEHIQQTLEKIQQKTGIPVYNLPKEREFFVNLQLEA